MSRYDALVAARGLLSLILVSGILAVSFPETTPPWLWPIPAETAVVALLAVLLPSGMATVWRALMLLAAGLVILLKTADTVTLAAFNRPFNPLLDTHLPRDGWNILSQSLGTGISVLILSGALLTLIVVLGLIGDGLARLRQWPDRGRRTLVVMCLVVIAAAAVQAMPVVARTFPQLANARASTHIIQRIERIAASADDLAAFRAQLAALSGPDQTPSNPPRLARLAGHDVLLVFVESYGRSALERPRYAEVIAPRLAAFETDIQTAGFSAHSAWLRSPTFGGQSWLAHGTLLSGLWVDNQPRYNALVESRRRSLNRVFARAGWRTAAVMPAITRDWPQGQWFGYDDIFAADDLGYAGKPFNWVTMPDQYTLAAIKRLILDAPSPCPTMIEAALISSHAPWTPIPPLLDWADIGNGRLFDHYATAGDPPEVVWQDTDRVRAQYRKAIDYSLETLASFITTQAQDDLVLIILGDHQPAPLVTGDNATRDVPIHIIAHDPAVLDAIDAWHWTPGMTPAAHTPVWPMDAFYQRFIDAYSATPPSGSGFPAD